MRAGAAAVVGLASALAACSFGLATDEYSGGGADAGAPDASTTDSAAPDVASSDARADGDASDGAIPDLVAHWPFDDAQGTTATNVVQGGPTGTLTNGATWAPGQIGTASIHFDGADDWVSVPASPVLVVNGAFTVTLWFRADTVPTNTDPRLYSDSGRFDIKLNAGHPQLTVGPDYYKVSYVVDTGTWYHLAVTFTTGKAAIYVNGTESAVAETIFTSTTALAARSGSSIAIGAFPNGVSAFDGRIDDVRLYARALTSTEVQSIFNAK